MRIYQKYLIREVTQSWVWVTLVLWAVLLTNQLVRYLGDAAAGDLPGQVIFQLVGLISVSFLVKLLPLSLFLATLLALGRLHKDSEMTALGACGIGTGQVYRPLLLLSVGAALLLAGLALEVVPATEAMRFETHRRAEQEMDVDLLVAGRFQEANDGRIILYASGISADRLRLDNLFVQGRRADLQGLLTARTARIDHDPGTGERFLVMDHGYRYEGFPGEADFRVMEFERHGYRLSRGTVGVATDRREARPTAVLLASRDRRDLAELQARFSPALASIVLMLLAVPLSRTSPRQGQYAKVTAGILVFVIYYNLLGTAQVWIEQGKLAPMPGLWWVHVLPVLLTAYLLRPRLRRPARNPA